MRQAGSSIVLVLVIAIVVVIAFLAFGVRSQSAFTALPAAAALGASQSASRVLTERQKIDKLIDIVANLENATFIRNDDEHSAKEAAAHMRRKLNAAGGRIKTAAQFIEHIASKSSTSGKLYRIRFSDGKELPSGEFLLSQLDRIERGETEPAAAKLPAASIEPAALEVVDRVMKRLGGEEAWNRTRYIQWRSFSGRKHVWDKQHHRDRIEFTDDAGVAHVWIIAFKTRAGAAWRDAAPVSDKDELAKMMQDAYAAWIDDSFWMFMPYRLKDDGVKLRHVGVRQLDDGRDADVLELTFTTGAGLAPHEKCHVYVGRDTNLVERWDCYERAQDRAPTISTPWTGWERHGDIWLAPARGEREGKKLEITEIAVYEKRDESLFHTP